MSTRRKAAAAGDPGTGRTAPAEEAAEGAAEEESEGDEEGAPNPFIDPQAAALLAAAIVQAQQAATAAGPPPGVPAAPAAPAVPPAPPIQPTPFALTPAMATRGLLDLSKDAGSRIFKEGTKSVYGKYDDPFDCTEGGLITFLNRVSNRCKEMGWDDGNDSLVMIPTSYDAANNDAKVGPFHNIITNYGEVTQERVKEWERKIKAKPDADGRLKQDLFMLYKCITASMSVEGEQKLSTWREDYVHDDILGGLSLLYVITREASLVTNASVESLRRELNDLDGFAVSVKGNVDQINAKAQTIVQKLRARGKDTTELITNLFKAYETIKDTNFERFIANIRDRHEEGAETITGEMLMLKATAKFKILKDQGKWNAPTEEAERLMALEHKMGTVIKKKKSDGKKDDSPRGGSSGNKTKQSKSRPGWLAKSIKPDDLKETKTYKDRVWHWCGKENGGKCGGRWRVHKPQECRGAASDTKRKAEDRQDGNDEEKKPDNKKGKIKAYAALMDAMQEEYDGEQSE